jgi:NAD(P)-dependent dehydrogenase (short-subunit alcohol dehydrogenase family)
MIHFEGKAVLITGGTSGIGLETARLARELGARVAVAGRRADHGRAAAAQVGSDVLFVPADVSQEGEVQRMVATVGERFGRLDVLVNNAGIISRRSVHEEDAARWDDLMGVNLRGTFLCCKYALPLLTAARGAIVNVASNLAFRTQQGRSPAYNASKAGVVALTQALAVRYGPDGVRANAVCPGFVPTELNRDTWERWTPEERTRVDEQYPLRRVGTPRDVANAILFLASDAAGWISGISLVIDGGRVAS